MRYILTHYYFGIDENEDLSKKPFSKPIIDISKELGLN
jgi:hypothetical protein